MIKINAGELKHPIIIQRKKNKLDDDKIPIKDWEDILYPRAKIKNVSGYEKVIAHADETSIDKKRFYIRYKRDLNLTNKDRIIYNNMIFNIIYASDIEDLHKYYEIVTEIVNNDKVNPNVN